MGNIISTSNTPSTNEHESVYNEKQTHFDELADSQRLLQNLKLRTSTAEASETVKVSPLLPSIQPTINIHRLIAASLGKDRKSVV